MYQLVTLCHTVRKELGKGSKWREATAKVAGGKYISYVASDAERLVYARDVGPIMERPFRAHSFSPGRVGGGTSSGREPTPDDYMKSSTRPAPLRVVNRWAKGVRW
jgi:hypothetical protein